MFLELRSKLQSDIFVRGNCMVKYLSEVRLFVLRYLEQFTESERESTQSTPTASEIFLTPMGMLAESVLWKVSKSSST